MAALDCITTFDPTETYNCSNPVFQDCVNLIGFDFPTLQTITQKIQQYCPTDVRLIHTNNLPATESDAALTLDACKKFVPKAWTKYANEAIYSRLQTWKIPLLQLALSTPRPPLGVDIDIFVLAHLMGDPVGTIRDLREKLSRCEELAAHFEKRGLTDRQWKALAMICIAFDEWGQGDAARELLDNQLKLTKITSKELDTFLTICIKISDQLAADRATAFLPIMAAQGIFIGALAIAMFKTASITPGSGHYISVEMHSIAFSALYFWIIPAVFISAVIGVSQTAKSIPNFLKTLQSEFNHHEFLRDMELPDVHFVDEHKVRILNGGIYSWQLKAKQQKDFRVAALENFIAVFSITSSIITSCLFSGYVPADGWQPRHCAYLFYFLMWVLSFVLTDLFKHCHSSNSMGHIEYQKLTTSKHPLRADMIRFRLTYLKDFMWTLGTIGPLMYIQAGPFNNCEAYSAWGRAGVALPEMPDIAKLLKDRIHGLYIGIAILGIGVQVCITVGSLWGCRKALRVLLQNDDGISLRPDWLRWSKAGRLQWPTRSERSFSSSSYMLGNFTRRN